MEKDGDVVHRLFLPWEAAHGVGTQARPGDRRHEDGCRQAAQAAPGGDGAGPAGHPEHSRVRIVSKVTFEDLQRIAEHDTQVKPRKAEALMEGGLEDARRILRGMKARRHRPRQAQGVCRLSPQDGAVAGHDSRRTRHPAARLQSGRDRRPGDPSQVPIGRTLRAPQRVLRGGPVHRRCSPRCPTCSRPLVIFLRETGLAVERGADARMATGRLRGPRSSASTPGRPRTTRGGRSRTARCLTSTPSCARSANGRPRSSARRGQVVRWVFSVDGRADSAAALLSRVVGGGQGRGRLSRVAASRDGAALPGAAAA